MNLKSKLNRLQKGFQKAIFLSLTLGLSSLQITCQQLNPNDGKAGAVARRVSTRSDLIGGNSALGEINDVLLENQQIRVIIQDKGYSRGFGVYGGSLIDADLVRANQEANSNGGRGRDMFGELFPIFFLQALNPEKVEILEAGGGGKSAKVQVTGTGGEFLSLTKVLNRALVNSYEGVDGFSNLGQLLPVLQKEGVAGLLKDEPKLNFSLTYTLPPDENYVIIDLGARNIQNQSVKIPSDTANQLFKSLLNGLAMEPFRVPVGFVALFGGGNQVFVPGYGYDLKFALEDSYALAGEAGDDVKKAKAQMMPLPPSQDLSLKLPALPGILSNGLISSSREGVSYGIFYIPEEVQEPVIDEGCIRLQPDAGIEADAHMGGYPVDGTPIPSLPLVNQWSNEGTFPKSFVYNLKDTPEEGVNAKNVYEKLYGQPVKPEDFLIPFSASSFTGIFSAQLPQVFGPACSEQSTFYARHLFIVGDGDISSVMDSYYRFKGTAVQSFEGRVLESISLANVPAASVLIYDENKRPVNQSFTNGQGRFKLNLPAGKYFARVEKDPTIGDFVPFEIKKDAGTSLELAYPAPAMINVEVRGEDHLPLPAKVTVVRGFEEAKNSYRLKDWLFDLSAGQKWRTDDLITNTADPQTRRYIETSAFTENGVVSLLVPPGGNYEIYVSRGTEYELLKNPSEGTLTLTAGQSLNMQAMLKRVINTAHYVSADFHLHADPSLDSDLPLRDRVITAAGEGLEHLVSTDHNFVTDYQPFINRENLNRFLSSTIGLELTTLEAGHFNTFPIKRDLNQITRGAFEWSNVPPERLFEKARSLKQDAQSDVIVQVNHPRDLILGYYSQYNLNALTGKVEEPETSSGFSIGALSSQLIGPNGEAFFNEEGKSQFSDKYDAIEVLNHGLFHEEFHTTMPANIGTANIYNAQNKALTPDEIAQIPVGSILCEDQEVSYAGAIDDWFNLLNLGYQYTGTANSDSHHQDDIGFPRTYVYVENDNPELVTSTEITKSVRNHQVTMSRGPFLEVFANGNPIGSLLKNTKEVQLQIKLQAPAWVEVNELTIVVNGKKIEKIPVEMKNLSFEVERKLNLDKDSWIVVYAKGDRSMFPVAAPIDLPPVLLNEAFGTIAGPLGLGGGPYEEIAPKMTGIFKPFAMSNPIWVDSNGDADADGKDFEAPGVVVRQCNDFYVEELNSAVDGMQKGNAWQQAKPKLTKRQLEKRMLSPSFGGFPRLKGDLSDIRIIFENFGSHGHGGAH